MTDTPRGMGSIVLPHSQLAKLLHLRAGLRITSIIDGVSRLLPGVAILVIEGEGLPEHYEGNALFNLSPSDVREKKK